MEMTDILRAAEETLALARQHGMDNCDMGHAPLEYSHLRSMIHKMGAPGFSIGKANRWLGYIQGVVISYAQCPLKRYQEYQ